jgi:hypothetical protein
MTDDEDPAREFPPGVSGETGLSADDDAERLAQGHEERFETVSVELGEVPGETGA